MRNYLSILIAAGTLSLFSCNAVDKPKHAENTNNVKIEFTGNESFIIKNPKFKVSLFGYDKFLADASATLITEKEYEQKSVPFTIDLPIPKDAANLVNPKKKEDIEYYIAVEWDSDGNGKPNEAGDVFIDHDKAFPNVKLNGETQKIYLKLLK